MPGAARLTDQVTCRCPCHTSTVSTTGNINTCSPDVIVNGLGAARLNDTAICNCGHTTIVVEGSPNVFVNGRPFARLGDAVSACPVGTITSSSNNVFVN